MDLNVEYCDETHVIEVALADTVEDVRRKVASAVGLPEDSFGMSFGDKAMGEGADMTQLSAGDTIFLKTTKRGEAIAALRALGETDLSPERLNSVKDPEVACLLLQAEVATVIPYHFLEETSITRLDLSTVSTVTRIEDEFLHLCRSLTAVDLSSFNSLTYVGTFFLRGCRSLTAVDLSSFNSLTHIEDGFLSGCTSLTALDLSSLSSLEHVGCDFLQDCTSLTALDLSSLSSVQHIEEGFCCDLIGTLQTLRLSGCSAVVSSAVEEVGLTDLVVDARPKRKRDESPEEDSKRPRLSQ